jgi:fructuronate reductase
MATGDRNWAIAGVSLRSRRVPDALAPQDGLYTVTTRSEDGDRTRLIGSVRNVVVASEDPETILRLIAAPSTSVVSFTITEKGYSLESAEAKADLRSATPSSIYGYLHHGLERRRLAGLPGLTLLSCDNLASNGSRLRNALDLFLDAVDPSLQQWVEVECTCPSTMVDRIAPAVTPKDLAAIEKRLGLRDEAAVVTEPFSQWVIEERFAGARPRWERVGATLVNDAGIHETAKLRMLNGAHSALAYLGLERGHEFVFQAIADALLRDLVNDLMISEAGSTLPPDFAVGQYADKLMLRFRNSALPHLLKQIAMDGSEKISQRWLPVLAARQRRGLQSPATLTALASWVRYVRGADGPIEDPKATELKSLWERAGKSGIVDALFGGNGLYCREWQASETSLKVLRQLVAGD